MIVDFLVLLAIALGLGAFLPAPATRTGIYLGFRLFGGMCLLMVLFFIALVPFHLGFETAARGLAVIAVFGWAWRLIPAIRTAGAYRHLASPVVVLPVVVVAVAFTHGPVEFIPYGYDTYANWLSHAKQVWLADDATRSGIHTGAIGYPPGWQLMLAFPASLWGSWETARVIAIPAALHVALLALVHDVVVQWWRDENDGPRHLAPLAGLGTVLLLLAAEASWKLVPTLILSEAPLFHTLTGLFVLALTLWFKDVRVPVVLFGLAITTGAHYLIKSQGLPAIPVAAGLAAVALWGQDRMDVHTVRRMAVAAALTLVPVVALFLIWRVHGPPSPRCSNDAVALLLSGWEQAWAGGRAGALLGDLASATSAYLATYKVPVSLVAAAGVGAGVVMGRTRWVALALLAYGGLYLFAVFWAYFSCPSSFNSYLSSLQRYLQPPVRAFHGIGALMLALAAMHWVVNRYREPLRQRSAGLAAVAVIAVLGAYQVTAVGRSLAVISSPPLDPAALRYVRDMPGETEALLAAAAKRDLPIPKVLMVHVYWEILPYLSAFYAGLPRVRPAAESDGVPRRWQLAFTRLDNKASPVPAVGKARSLEDLLTYDVIWPVDESDWLRQVLRGRVDPPDCLSNLTQFYLFRTPGAAVPFTCVPRASALP